MEQLLSEMSQVEIAKRVKVKVLLNNEQKELGLNDLMEYLSNNPLDFFACEVEIIPPVAFAIPNNKIPNGFQVTDAKNIYILLKPNDESFEYINMGTGEIIDYEVLISTQEMEVLYEEKLTVVIDALLSNPQAYGVHPIVPLLVKSEILHVAIVQETGEVERALGLFAPKQELFFVDKGNPTIFGKVSPLGYATEKYWENINLFFTEDERNEYLRIINESTMEE